MIQTTLDDYGMEYKNCLCDICEKTRDCISVRGKTGFVYVCHKCYAGMIRRVGNDRNEL